jgi:putative transposon-encoded protein
MRDLGKMSNEKKSKNGHDVTDEKSRGKVKFEVYGEEMVEKVVKLSGNSGRVYLPPDWVKCRVKIIRVD